MDHQSIAPSALEPSTHSEPGGPTRLSVLDAASGIEYDFNDGCRVYCPPGSKWRVVIRDLDTGNVLFSHEFSGGITQSARRSYVRFGFEVWREQEQVFKHEYNAADQLVKVDMSLGALGDHLAWFGQIERFVQKTSCRLTCVMRQSLIDLLQPAYPHIRMITPQDVDKDKTAYYASYKVCIFFNDSTGLYQPSDYRLVGLCATAAYILGLPPVEARPLLPALNTNRPIEEPYVCIAVQASGQSKYWNNPTGWQDVVAHLKQRGYRVICIDQQALGGRNLTWTPIPHGAEDQTGNRPLLERAWWLKHAAFFVGLSSGLSWLAWAAQCPVVMVSGFTHPQNEFSTPYRVINFNVCNSCANDVRHRFEPTDYFWCPRHAGTPRQFECTRMITSMQTISMINQLESDLFGQAALSGGDVNV